MNKTATKVLALCAAAMMTLTACTGNAPATEEEKPSDAASTETKDEQQTKKTRTKLLMLLLSPANTKSPIWCCQNWLRMN